MNTTINVGIIGFGLSGRYFFSPFINTIEGFKLSYIVSSQSSLINSIYPEATVLPSIDELLKAEGLDLVVVASPNATHYDYVKAALLAGKHVIAEKPFTVTSQEAMELKAIAEEKQLLLSPFQNRRWDGDFLSIKKLLEEGKLGELLEFESHFDRYRPGADRVQWKMEAEPGAGVLYDLGVHLIDQALTLFGTPKHIWADIRTQRIDGQVDDYFDLHLYYKNLKVILKAGVFVKTNGPRFILHGRKGSFIKYGLDTQEEMLKAGSLPTDATFGEDKPECYGMLETDGDNDGVSKIRTEKGCYTAYFENVYKTICGDESLIVKAADAIKTIRVIELAYKSNEIKARVPFEL